MPASELTRRQREILDVARALLAREGVEALTVGRLAGELGIKPPSLYKHFTGKRRLEAVLIAEGSRRRRRRSRRSARTWPASRAPTGPSRSRTRSSTG